MPAHAKYTHDEILEAAARITSCDGLGKLTVSEVCRELGAPSGSVYHRFPSRAELVANLWLSVVESFQQSVLPKLQHNDPRAALADSIAAAFDWVEDNPNQAHVLLLHHQRDFKSGTWPSDLEDRAREQAANLSAAHKHFVTSLPPPRPQPAVATLALFGITQAALRDSIHSRRPPDPALAPAATRAALAVIGL